jgi:hypothetical protein
VRVKLAGYLRGERTSGHHDAAPLEDHSQRPACGYLFTCLTAGARPGSVEVSGGTLSKRLSTAAGVRLTHGMRSRWAPWRGEAQEGLPSPK